MQRRLGGVIAPVICVLVGCGGGSSSAPDAAPDDDIDAAAPPDAGPDAGGDTTPPAPPAGLSATWDGSEVDLAWTNPADADFAEVIVVGRVGAAIAGAPADGTTYAVDDEIATGEVVVYAGAGTSAQDEDVPPGLVHYAAFARDAAGNWSGPVRASEMVPAPPQTGVLTVTLAPAPTVTVTEQPPHYALAGTAVYDDVNDVLTVTLTATSNFGRDVFAPKAVITTVNQGTVPGDGTYAGDPYERLGHGVAPGGDTSGDLVVTGVDGTVDPVVIDLEIVDHPVGIAFLRYHHDSAYELIDSGTMSSMGLVACDALLYEAPGSNGYCTYRAGAMRGDGDRFYAGHRSLPVVRSIDPVTHTVVASTMLDTGLGAVRAVALSPDDADLYALLILRGHTYDGGAGGAAGKDEDHVLVRLDAATLVEEMRLVIGDAVPAGDARLPGLAVSPDGTRVAVTRYGTAAGVVHLIDAAAMTELDADPGTDGTQPIDVSAVIDQTKHVIFDGTTSLIVQGQSSDDLARVDLSNFSATALASGGDTGNSGGLARGPGSRIFACHTSPTSTIAAIDGTTVTGATTPDRAKGMAVSGDRLYVVTDAPALHVFDATTLAEVDTGGGAPLAGTPSHAILFTPF